MSNLISLEAKTLLKYLSYLLVLEVYQNVNRNEVTSNGAL